MSPYPARAVVDLAAIRGNVAALAGHAPTAQVMAVVKADAYGHGLVPVARAALAGGATWLGTAQVSEALALRDRYASRGGFNAVLIRLRLSDGRLYDKTGHLNFASNTITTNTDTLSVRGEITNPTLFQGVRAGTPAPTRELVDGEFVTVLLEGVQPVQVLAVPRASVLNDQQGSYVYVVGSDNTVEQRRIHVGQSTTTLAGVISGLQQGEHVIAEGLQKVRPGAKVAPGPASAQFQAMMTQNDGEGESGQNGSAAGAANSSSGDQPPSTTGNAPANANQTPGGGASSPQKSPSQKKSGGR